MLQVGEHFGEFPKESETAFGTTFCVICDETCSFEDKKVDLNIKRRKKTMMMLMTRSLVFIGNCDLDLIF